MVISDFFSFSFFLSPSVSLFSLPLHRLVQMSHEQPFFPSYNPFNSSFASSSGKDFSSIEFNIYMMENDRFIYNRERATHRAIIGVHEEGKEEDGERAGGDL